MEIIKGISGGLGLQTATVQVEIISGQVILGEEFDLVITVKAGEKGLKGGSLDVGLFWWYLEKEFDPYKGQSDFIGRVPVMVQEKRTAEPFEVPPHKERYFNIGCRTDPDLKYTMGRFGWFLKVHAGVPWAPDERKEFPVDVLPKIELSAPLISLVKNLGFTEVKKKREGDERSCRFRLMPPPALCAYLKYLDLEVEDMYDGTVDMQLEMEMICDKDDDFGYLEDTRTVARRVFMNKGMFRRSGGGMDLEPVTALLRETIWMTVNQFMEDPYIPSFKQTSVR